MLITNFGLIAKPLYNSLKGLNSEPFGWTRDCQVAFNTLKEKLFLSPMLGLSNLQKPFKLYIHERQRIWLDSLTQTLENISRLITSLKEVGSHNKGMATISLSSGSSLWHLTGRWEVHFGTAYYGISITPGPDSVGTERRVLTDGRVHREIPGHSLAQHKYYLADYHNFESDYSTPTHKGKLSPPAWLFGNYWWNLV